MTHVYLTVAGRKQLLEQIRLATLELADVETRPPGTCAWRIQRRYIDGLEFLLDMEQI